MSDARPWYERWPDLEAWELARFEARELPAEVDQTRRADGQLVIHTRVEYAGRPVDVEVAYPSEYPELPPIVIGPPGLLDRHQHAFGGGFCLLERVLDDWKAQEWGAADLIAEQLLRLLRDSEAGHEAVRAAEAPMPEPVTAYYDYSAGAAVVVPEELVSPDGECGQLRLVNAFPHLFIVESVDELSAGDTLRPFFNNGAVLRGHWARLRRAPDAPTGPALAAWVRQHHPHLLARRVPPALARKSTRMPTAPALEVVGLTFREEGPDVGETRDAWLFLVVDRRGPKEHECLLHAQVFSAEERQRRIPELRGLNDARAVVIGLGSLGADVALHLARAGVGSLDLVDFDRFEITNPVRHPLTVEFAGLQKSSGVARACRSANPYCVADEHELRFGADRWPAGHASPAAQLIEIIDGADVVIDASGSHQIAQFVARIAAEGEVPMIAGWMTEGAWGAEIVRIELPRTACWTCFATRLLDGDLPTAETGPATSVVIQGCSHPTTAGAGFDIAETAAMVARLAISTLKPAGGYPESEWDYAAVSFRRRPDDADKPRFATADLPPNEQCQVCRPAAVGSNAQR